MLLPMSVVDYVRPPAPTTLVSHGLSRAIDGQRILPVIFRRMLSSRLSQHQDIHIVEEDRDWNLDTL